MSNAGYTQSNSINLLEVKGLRKYFKVKRSLLELIKSRGDKHYNNNSIIRAVDQMRSSGLEGVHR
jgi:hypothetical protein